MRLGKAWKAVAGSLAFATALASASASDGSVAIDFEHFPGPDGILGSTDDAMAPLCADICGLLSDQFSSMGVTFTSGTLFQGNLFPGSSPSNHYISSTPLDATLARTVTGISVTSYSMWTATLYALDENNNVIASDTLINPHAGSSFLLGTLNLSVNHHIRRFAVLAAGCEIGLQCDHILNLDDLLLMAPEPEAATATASIPSITEPGLVVLMIVLGTSGLLLIRVNNGTTFNVARSTGRAKVRALGKSEQSKDRGKARAEL